MTKSDCGICSLQPAKPDPSRGNWQVPGFGTRWFETLSCGGGHRQLSCRRAGGEADIAAARSTREDGRRAVDEAGRQQPDGNLQVLHHAAATIASRGAR